MTLSTRDAGTAKTESMDTIGSNDAMGENVPVQETGHFKQKHIPMQNTSDALNRCLCGVVLHSECNRVLKCKKIGCETQWVSISVAQINHYNSLIFQYHLQCVSLELPHEIGYAKPVRHLGKAEDQNNHKDDVIFLFIEMCLIT